jgi:hypothetical protein
MKRRITLTVSALVNSLRSTGLTGRPMFVRRVLAPALCLALVLAPLPGKGRVAPEVQAQIDLVCPTVLGNRILQPCYSGLHSTHSAGLENGVIDDLLAAHQLPAEDKSRLLAWERNLIRAQLFNKLLGYILKAPGERTEAEGFFVAKLTDLIKQRRILAATKALDEYNLWAINPCAYTAPTGFYYEIPCSCVNHLCGLTGGPLPPSFEEFQNYGAAFAYKDFQDKPELREIAGKTALGLGILGGFVAAGIAGAIGGAIGASLTVSSAIIVAIHPMLAAAVAGTKSAAAIAAVSGATAGVTGAVSIAAVFAIVVIAIVIGIVQGIAVFEAEAIPGKLQEAKDAAINANIDIAQLASTDAGKREIFSEFLLATMPEPPAPTSVPEATAADRQFFLQPGDAVTPILQYQDWNEEARTARLSGGWFVDRAGSTGAERLTLSINYLDWNGKAWTATRVGKQFLHTRNGDTEATPVRTPEIKYKNWTDQLFTAKINNAPPTISLTSASVKQQGGSGGLVSQVIGTVGDQDDPVDQLAVSVISDNPSNGVSIGVNHFSNQIQAFATATCTASNASFTINVTDPGGAVATGTLNVTVIPNDPPLLGYLPPPSLTVGGSITVSPAGPPTDPDGFFAPSIGTPTISPSGFNGAVTVDQFGVVKVTNATPPGFYQIKVPVSDDCTTINAGFNLQVACPAITASVNGGGYICPGASSTVSVNVWGGTAPYTVKLSDGQMKTSSSLPITFSVSPSTATTYTATATDAYGCPATVTGSAVVTPNTLPTLAYTNKSLGVGKTAMFYPSSGPGDNMGISSIALHSVSPASGLELSVNNSTGVVSVLNAAVAGSYLVGVEITNNCGQKRTASFSVSVTCPTTTLGALANGQAGVAYNRSITVSPAANGYAFEVISGALPPGLVLDKSTGDVTGAPSATGTFNFSVRATSSGGCSGVRAYSLVVSCPQVAITPTTLPAGTVGVAYNQALTAAPAGNYGFVVSMGSLPPGLKLDAATGVLGGTPTMKGSYYISIRANGFGSCTGSRTYMLVVQ